MDSHFQFSKRFIQMVRTKGISPAAKSAFQHIISNCIPTGLKYNIYSTQKKVLGQTGIGNPLRVYHVNPDRIEHIYSGDGLKFISGGNWDVENKTHLDDWFRMSMFIKHFKHGVPWREIEEYQNLESRLKKQGHIGTLDIPKDEQSVETLHDYYKYIDGLYEDIKNNGYRSQEDLGSRDDFASRNSHPALNEIQVCIGRDGCMMVYTGYHRFTISKILGIKSIPVRTKARHSEWQKIRNEISKSHSKSKLRPDLHKYIGHPELQDIVESK